MDNKLKGTKPCFLEGGLPCASLSAECQRDNNARQRPPQNRLHIWWARRPPTISRAAVLSALLPHDLQLDESVLPPMVSEPSEEDLENLPPKLQPHREFFQRLLKDVQPTALAPSHKRFLKALGVTGDVSAAYQRIASANNYRVGGKTIQMPVEWGYRHPAAFSFTPLQPLLNQLVANCRDLLNFEKETETVVLDYMAGGGAIPLEATRYGFKVFANELNPVASLVLKATIEYPAKLGRSILPFLESFAEKLAQQIGDRLSNFFFHQSSKEWWPEASDEALAKFTAQTIVKREPAGKERIQATLWCRTVPCAKCDLNIPISTNFHIVNKKGKPEAAIAAFPEVPERWQGNDCTFRIVKRAEWKNCRWPRPDFDTWHPRNTPTFKAGNAICPRCGNPVDRDKVKEIARSRPGGLPSQMYAVCSQVPVKLTYQNGDEKVRYLWRFRAPTRADLDAVQAAEQELARLLPKWEARGLVPTEEIPLNMEDRRPRDYGMTRWRDLFLPRQLLTNITILDEILAAQREIKKKLPEEEAEAVSVYLAFILSKVVNYNSVNTFWDYTRQ